MLTLLSNDFNDISFAAYSLSNGTGKGSSGDPFEEEEEWDEADNVLVDNGEPGVPVKALYDYDGAESDELSFKQGIDSLYIYISLHMVQWIDKCKMGISGHNWTFLLSVSVFVHEILKKQLKNYT